MEALRSLADDFNAQDPRKLYRLARQRDLDATQAMAFEALKADVGRQVQAPPAARCGQAEGLHEAAVVGWGIQTLKKDLATRVARKGGQWSDHFERAAGAYNARPHETVHGAPELSL